MKRLLSTDYADKVIVTTIQKLGLALMEDLVPQFKKLAQGREISGLSAYEHK